MGQLRKRGGVWWIRYYRNGQRYEESCGSDKKTKAIDLLKIREGDTVKGLPVTPQIARLRFDEAVKDVVTDYTVNRKAARGDIERKIRLHLAPYFSGYRMTAITTAEVRTYIAQRQAPIVDEDGHETPGAANAQINRELAILKRAFKLSLQAGKLLVMPYIPMLAENNVRQGFFERHQFERVRQGLPAYVQGLVTFAYVTGWRIQSEILPLEWRQVDRKAGIVRLEPGTTKNDDGRTFPYGTALPELRTVIDAQWRDHVRLQKAGTIVSRVFQHHGKPIKHFRKAWQTACAAAGCPGKIPHDFRRTAVRNLVRAGVPERTAMLLTGHKTRSVFDRYDIVNEGDLREAIGRLAIATGTKKGQFAKTDPIGAAADSQNRQIS
jgi:integrase